MYSFSLIIKPIIYAIMLISIGIFVKEIGKAIKNKKYFFVVIYILASIIALVIPSVLESWYLVMTKILGIILCTVVYAAYAVTYAVLKVLGKIKDLYI